MYHRGMIIGGLSLMLTVKRCGLSFKFIGHDLARCSVYVGYVYGPQVRLHTLHTLHMPPHRPPRVPVRVRASLDPRPLTLDTGPRTPNLGA